MVYKILSLKTRVYISIVTGKVCEKETRIHPSLIPESHDAKRCPPNIIYSSRVIHSGSPGSFSCRRFSVILEKC